MTLSFALSVPPAARRASAVLALLLLGACSTLPERPQRPLTYDFGPAGPAAAPASPQPALAPLVLADGQSAAALEGTTAVLYRLAYADAQQLLPYAQARWSAPPAQLVRQRLHETLGQRRSVLLASDGSTRVRSQGQPPAVLRLQLEEFSQIFDSPGSSAGVLRLRATLLQPDPEGERLIDQHRVQLQRPAPSPDAAGGVRALAQASDAAAQEIAAWLEQRGH